MIILTLDFWVQLGIWLSTRSLCSLDIKLDERVYGDAVKEVEGLVATFKAESKEDRHPMICCSASDDEPSEWCSARPRITIDQFL